MKLQYSWMENTVIQHTFLKFDQNQTNPRFSIKNPEPQMKQKNPRSSEKSPAVATLIVTVCATKMFIASCYAFLHKVFVAQNARTCDALVLTDLSTPHSAVIAQCDVTKTTPSLKQKRIVTLLPGRTDPRISPRRPISIKLISRAVWANHGNCQCAEKVQSRSC